MFSGLFLLLFQAQGVVLQTQLSGFELLDTFYSGHVPSGDSIVQAITPFSTKLSICYWFYQPWARTHAYMGAFELRTTLNQKQRDIPSNSNWPNIYGAMNGGGLYVQSVSHSKFPNKTENINLIRKWIHACFSFDFLENEFQYAMNGYVFEKLKDFNTSKIYENQVGGRIILQETENSNFFFAFGRYHFDDARHIVKFAGVNAWSRTLDSEELSELSSCESHNGGDREGDILNSKTKWIYQKNDPFIRESEFDVPALLCTEKNKENIIPLAMPLDTKENVVDTCKKFGSDVVLGGTLRGIEDMEYYVHVVTEISSKHFKESCGTPTRGRFYTWLPYNFIENGTVLVHDITKEVYTLGFFTTDYKQNKDHRKIVSYLGKNAKIDEKIWAWGKTGKACGMCIIPSSVEKTTVVKLRGVCSYSEFDKEYQVSVDENGDIIYYGIRKTIIQYNYTLLAWQMYDVVNPNVFATFESSFRTMGLGTNIWTVKNDLQCQKGELTTSLSLSACLDSPFTCGDGLCIKIDERCDGNTDCKDMTDEIECKVIQMDSGYNKLLTPPPGEDNEKVRVTIDVGPIGLIL